MAKLSTHTRAAAYSRTAANQDELEALIQTLNPEGVRRNCADIREYFGYYETGRATDAVCDYILERLGNLEALKA